MSSDCHDMFETSDEESESHLGAIESPPAGETDDCDNNPRSLLDVENNLDKTGEDPNQHEALFPFPVKFTWLVLRWSTDH